MALSPLDISLVIASAVCLTVGIVHGLGAAAAARGQISHFAYYSFVTLSTLGYGEVTPITRPARSLAALEAIVGQLYLAILIARLVSQHLSSSSDPVPASAEAAH
jgi:hypothetical protein